jgi:hypothetical protein
MTTVDEGAPSGNGGKRERDSSRKKQTAEKPHWVAYVEACCAVLLVLITGTYTYYAAGQLHQMKRSTDAATRAAKAAEDQGKLAYVEERAWVGVVTAALKYKRPPRKGEHMPPLTELLAVMVKITNTGRTPAVNLRIGAKGAIVPNGEGIAPRIIKYDYSLMGNLTPNADT